MVSIRQVKAARALLAWSQQDLAEGSGVSYATIARLEASDADIGARESGQRVIDTLQDAGVTFLEDNGGGSGVRLRRKPG